MMKALITILLLPILVQVHATRIAAGTAHATFTLGEQKADADATSAMLFEQRADVSESIDAHAASTVNKEEARDEQHRYATSELSEEEFGAEHDAHATSTLCEQRADAEQHADATSAILFEQRADVSESMDAHAASSINKEEARDEQHATSAIVGAGQTPEKLPAKVFGSQDGPASVEFHLHARIPLHDTQATSLLTTSVANVAIANMVLHRVAHPKLCDSLCPIWTAFKTAHTEEVKRKGMGSSYVLSSVTPEDEVRSKLVGYSDGSGDVGCAKLSKAQCTEDYAESIHFKTLSYTKEQLHKNSHLPKEVTEVFSCGEWHVPMNEKESGWCRPDASKSCQCPEDQA